MNDGYISTGENNTQVCADDKETNKIHIHIEAYFAVTILNFILGYYIQVHPI